MLQAANVPFLVKDSFEILFLCDYSVILTKLIEFYYFLIAFGRLLFVFQPVKMILNVWFMIGVCVFKRIQQAN